VVVSNGSLVRLFRHKFLGTKPALWENFFDWRSVPCRTRRGFAACVEPFYYYPAVTFLPGPEGSAREPRNASARAGPTCLYAQWKAQCRTNRTILSSLMPDVTGLKPTISPPVCISGSWLERNRTAATFLQERFDESLIVHSAQSSERIARWAYSQAAAAHASPGPRRQPSRHKSLLAQAGIHQASRGGEDDPGYLIQGLGQPRFGWCIAVEQPMDHRARNRGSAEQDYMERLRGGVL